MGAINVATITEIVPSNISCIQAAKPKKGKVSPTGKREGASDDSPSGRPRKHPGNIKIIIECVDDDEEIDQSEAIQKQDRNFLALEVEKQPTASIIDEIEAEEKTYREQKA